MNCLLQQLSLIAFLTLIAQCNSSQGDRQLPASSSAVASASAEVMTAENTPLLALIERIEADNDRNGDAARKLCELHRALTIVTKTVEDLLRRKSGSDVASCINENPLLPQSSTDNFASVASSSAQQDGHSSSRARRHQRRHAQGRIEEASASRPLATQRSSSVEDSKLSQRRHRPRHLNSKLRHLQEKLALLQLVASEDDS